MDKPHIKGDHKIVMSRDWRTTRHLGTARLSYSRGQSMQKTAIAKWDDLKDRQPEYAIIGEVDLVIVRFDAKRFRCSMAAVCTAAR